MSKTESNLSKAVGVDDVLHNRNILRQSLAELLGTLLLVFIGVGSTAAVFQGTQELSIATTVKIALCFGLTVATLAEMFSHVSGCHINPAITVGLLMTGQCTVLKAVVYIIAQCVGAIIGAVLINEIVNLPELNTNLGVTTLAPGVSMFRGFLVELIITFILVMVVCAICDEERTATNGSAPLAIGLSITACHLFAIPFTGSSMNPARSLGPAVINNNFEDHWVYWVGPCIGGALAGIIYRFLFKVQKMESFDLPCN